MPGCSAAHMDRVKSAALAVHRRACERCALLAVLCPACSKAVGECPTVAVIERLPVDDEDGKEDGDAR